MPDAPPPTVVPVGNATEVTGQIDPQRVARGLYDALASALAAVGEKAVAEIKDALSIPVEVGEGGKIIRSSPGEPPRKEFGVLQENVEFHVTEGDGAIPLPELVVSSSRPPISANDDPEAPRVLELELDRPYMTPAVVRVAGYAKEELVKHLK